MWSKQIPELRLKYTNIARSLLADDIFHASLHVLAKAKTPILEHTHSVEPLINPEFSLALLCVVALFRGTMDGWCTF